MFCKFFDVGKEKLKFPIAVNQRFSYAERAVGGVVLGVVRR